MTSVQPPEDTVELPVIDHSPEDTFDHIELEDILAEDDELIADGNHLGATIDIEDDTDSGARMSY